jgi:heavy metal sensor kinase
MKSLHRLIQRSALLLVGGLLLLFSFLLYSGFRTLVHHFIDGRLLGLAATLADIVEQSPEAILRGTQTLVPADGNRQQTRQELQAVAHSVLIYSAGGSLVWKGTDVGNAAPLTDAARERIRGTHHIFETADREDGIPVRRLFVSIPQQGPARYILRVEVPLSFAEKTLQGLIALLFLGSCGILLVAWLGSGWLSRKVLLPIESLSAMAETMSVSDVPAQLSLNSPYREFHRLTKAFNATMDRFVRSGESQARFVDYAAHELQTPLTVLQGNLEVILQKARSADEYREVLISNLEQVERLIVLTRSLLTLTKFAGDRTVLERTRLELEPLLRELVSELTLLAEDRNIALTMQAVPVPVVLADPNWLKQAVINLIDNALRYTPPGGAVTLRLEKDDENVLIAVEDTGQGIEPEHVPFLFERFYRTDRARAKDSGGTGLGLPIVKEIIEGHGGCVTIESRVGRGSIFTLHLPVPHSGMGAA